MVVVKSYVLLCNSTHSMQESHSQTVAYHHIRCLDQKNFYHNPPRVLKFVTDAAVKMHDDFRK